MNILITGGDGFIGKNLVNFFIEDNYNILYPNPSELDLRKIGSVNEYFDTNQIDIIIHSATTLRTGTSYPPNTFEYNLRMFFNLARQMKKGMKMFSFGSGSEYTREFWHENMHEDFFDLHVPKDSHSYSKYLISKYIEEVSSQDITSLRIFGIFGKYEDYRFKFISNAIAKNLMKMPIIINQDADYDYLYIDDFCRIMKLLIENGTKYKSYNVTPDLSINLIKIANIINSISNYQSDIEVLNHSIGTRYSGDNKRVMSELKKFEFMNYKDSIEDLYNYYKRNISIINENELKDDSFLNYAKELKAKRDNKINGP
jgi:UDP-glucose 4-epimerase